MCGITAGIAEDGELVVKGPLVCKGYHNNPGVTAQQITDGWLHTGDLGDISEDGFISITGRKKDLIITAGGKNVSPGLLEASVMTSPVVNQCLVIGDKKPFVAALVTLDLAVPTIGWNPRAPNRNPIWPRWPRTPSFTLRWSVR